VIPIVGCGRQAAFRLVTDQTVDLAAADHKGHLAPGQLATISVSIRNTGAGPARGITVEDLLPDGFHFYELTTLGGNAVRTSIQDPAGAGNPRWGTWTLPAPGSQESELVLSFKVQAGLRPGEFQNRLQLSVSGTPIDAGQPLALVVEPRPSLSLTAATLAPSATSGSQLGYVLSVTNVGSAPAKRVTISASLPPGFLYAATSGYEGNASRVSYVDPPGNSLLPVWAAWDIPPMANGTPGLLQIRFLANLLPGVPPGTYTIAATLTGAQDIPASTAGNLAPVAVGKGTSIPISMRVAATSPYVAQGGVVTYVITVENDSNSPAQQVTITDTLPQGFNFQSTRSIVITGKSVTSRLQPAQGAATPQWGPFTIPAGGFNGATLVITFTVQVSASSSLGPHANVVSGNSSNAQLAGGADQVPVIVTVS
jgi:uncharacterized repeat protein (TIGR01451 family)